jgi:hypothetical protein
MLKVCCFLWQPENPLYRSKFEIRHVNILKNMVKRNLHLPHEFICITDRPNASGYDSDVSVIPLWQPIIPNGFNNLKPNCYRRLKLFAPEAKEIIGGDRFLWLDLDCVIVSDITPLITQDDFKIWCSHKISTQPYNGSMVLHTIGTRPQVWKNFNANISWQKAKEKGFQGSDQAYLGYILGRNEATWTKEKDGVYSWRLDIQNNPAYLPSNARIVFFHGKVDPWHNEAKNLKWVKENYR